MNAALNTLARLLIRIGFSANAVTICGFAMGFPAAFFIARGEFLAGAAFIALSGLFDLIDGRVARLLGANSFGALLDSSLDRLSDALFYGSILYYYASIGELFYTALAFSAAAGAFEISYIRARSEGLGRPCQVGFWERGERTVLILAGLLADNLGLVVLYLGVLTHLTALVRLLHAKKCLAGGPDGAPKGPGRAGLAWRLQAAFYLLSLWVIRP